MAAEDIQIKIKALVDGSEAVKTLGDLKLKAKGLKDELEKSDMGSANFKKLSGELKSTEKQLDSSTKGLKAYHGGLSQIAGTLPGVTGVMEVFNAVMSANPVGIVVASLFALYELLKQNAEVAEGLSAIFEGLGKMFHKIADDIVDLGKKILKALSDPKQALIDLIEFIKTNVINRFKAIGKIMEAIANKDFKALGNATLQLTTGIENLGDKVANYGKELGGVAKQGYDAARAQQELTKKTGEYNEAIEKNNLQIEKSKEIAMDKTKSEKDRIAAAKLAISLEDQNAAKLEELAREELKINEEKNKGLTLTSEQQKEQSDLRVKITRIETEKVIKSKKTQIRLNDLLGRSEKRNTLELKKEVKERDKYNKELEELSKSFYTNERQKISDFYDEKNDKIVGNSQLEINLRTKLEEEKAKALADYDAKELERATAAENKKQEEIFKAKEDAFNKGIGLVEQTNIKEDEAKLKHLEKTKSFDIKAQLDLLTKLSQDKIKYLNDKMNIDLQNTTLTEEERKAIVFKTNEEIKTNEEQTQDAIQKKRKDSVEGGIALAGQFASAIDSISKSIFDIELSRQHLSEKEKNKILKRQFKTQKALGIVNAGIGTANAVVQALSSTAPPASYVLAALNAAAGVAQIAAIAAKKFNPEGGGSSGGSVHMPSFSSGSAGTGAQPQAPRMFGLGGSQLNTQNMNPPQKVYVTTTDMNHGQNRVRVAEGRAKVG